MLNQYLFHNHLIYASLIKLKLIFSAFQCEYVLRLKQGVEANQHISRISPSNLKVQAEGSDVTNIRIIAWRPPPNCDVAVHVVNCPTGVNLRLRLYRESEPDGHIFEKKLEPSTVPQHYFILPVLANDGKSYFVQVALLNFYN